MSTRPSGGSEAGLCAGCRHARPQASARGSRFWRCGRSAEDSRWPRYPALPVRACSGFEPSTGQTHDREGGAAGSGGVGA